MDSTGVPDLPLRMRRGDLASIPRYRLPPGFRLRSYSPGDESAWLEIHRNADLRNTFDGRTFRRQFGTVRSLIASRQLYLEEEGGALVGTSTGWFKASLGRVHWVAIRPDYQGRGLAKPLLAGTLSILARFGHESVYLTTSASRLAALCLYTSFGFAPEPRSAEEERAWERLSALIAGRLAERSIGTGGR